MSVETVMEVSPDLGHALVALKPEVLLRSVSRGMERGTLLIAGSIQKERLSGKGPYPVPEQRLGIMTGRLRKAVRSTKPKISSMTVTTSIGANVGYAAAHEFGFEGVVNVKAHEVTMKKLFGRKLKKPLRFTRLASSRRMKVPERRPFRAGIQQNMGMLEQEVAREVVNEVKGAGS